ncbi:MAG: hypothetical protein ACJ72W_15345 [Actinoallomurus sp.]
MSGGLATAKNGADRLVAGLAELDSGAAKLQSGSAQVAAGTQRLTTMFDQVTGRLLPVLREHPGGISNAALLVANGADAAATALDALPNQTAQAVRQASAARKTICALAATHPEAAPACAAATTVLTTAEQVNARYGRTPGSCGGSPPRPGGSPATPAGSPRRRRTWPGRSSRPGVTSTGSTPAPTRWPPAWSPCTRASAPPTPAR